MEKNIKNHEKSREILQQILKISFLGWKNGRMVGRSFHYKFGVHFPGKMARCIVFSQSSVPSGNSPADPPDPADPPEEAESR